MQVLYNDLPLYQDVHDPAQGFTLIMTMIQRKKLKLQVVSKKKITIKNQFEAKSEGEIPLVNIRKQLRIDARTFRMAQ